MIRCEYDIIHTFLGDLTVIFTDKGICRIGIRKNNPDYLTRSLAEMDLRPVMCTPSSRTPETINRGKLVQKWRDPLEIYFQGKPVVFNIPLDIREGTVFQKKVWEVLGTIPYGETRPYGWVAGRTGNVRASRAVGRANAANPIPILIPCHRVVRSDGLLGGFSSGVNVKKALLRLEGFSYHLPRSIHKK